ncbi:hypothetical protein ASC93_08180 [Massilia sp. Root335]|nr:hypothetical protein ASC93_08180 [Massilia sp. Root335]
MLGLRHTQLPRCRELSMKSIVPGGAMLTRAGMTFLTMTMHSDTPSFISFAATMTAAPSTARDAR